MALYWLRRPEFEVFEFTGDIQALLDWSLAQDISGTETIVKRIVPHGENGFQYFMAWDWTPDLTRNGRASLASWAISS